MEYDDWEELDELERDRPRDAAIDEAIPHVRGIFDASPVRVFYSTQIETLLERQYFHWITGKALLELANGGHLQRLPVTMQNRVVNFYAHPRHRYWKREQKKLQQLLERIFDPEFTHAIGRHGEMMFDSALSRQNFRYEARDANSWQGNTWEQTNHNMDRIVTRDGIAYGVEIKNTQNYITHDELLTKIALCRHIGVHPLFIMRSAPKSYIYEVINRGGIVLLFDEQLYPWGHSTLLSEVKSVLGLKVQSPRDIKEGDMVRLLKAHATVLRRK